MNGKSSNRSGNAVLELALSMPVLVGLALGTLQFGYSFYVYNELEQAVRAGARYASLRDYASSTKDPDPAYMTAVKNVVVYANPQGGTLAVIPGLKPEYVMVNVDFPNKAPVSVTVAISGYTLPQIIGGVPLKNKPSTQFPYMGVFAPPAN